MPAGDWWKGTLRLRIWESLIAAFPASSVRGKDSAGNQIVSEVTKLSLNTPIPDHLFGPAGNVAFFPGPRAQWARRRGPIRMAGTAPVHLADSISNANALGGRKSRFSESATTRSTHKVLLRAPTWRRSAWRRTMRTECRRVRAGALFSGRGLQAGGTSRREGARSLPRDPARGKPVSVTRITAPWIEETQRFVIAGRSGDEVSQMANYLVKVPRRASSDARSWPQQRRRDGGSEKRSGLDAASAPTRIARCHAV